MAGAPQQTLPLAEFPGLEYFGNAPGRHVTIERRVRTHTIATSFTSVAASGSGSSGVTVSLDGQFGFGKAIYIHDLRGIFDPADGAAQLQITGVFAELQCPPGQAFYELGYPTLTLSTPSVQSTAMVQSDFLITFADAQALGTSAGTNVAPGNLQLNLSINVKNLDGAGAHSYRVRALGLWRILSGILE